MNKLASELRIHDMDLFFSADADNLITCLLWKMTNYVIFLYLKDISLLSSGSERWQNVNFMSSSSKTEKKKKKKGLCLSLTKNWNFMPPMLFQYIEYIYLLRFGICSWMPWVLQQVVLLFPLHFCFSSVSSFIGLMADGKPTLKVHTGCKEITADDINFQ